MPLGKAGLQQWLPSKSATKEIIALNSPAGAEPWPIPVVLVGERDESVNFIAAAGSGGELLLLLDGNDIRDARARNVDRKARSRVRLGLWCRLRRAGYGFSLRGRARSRHRIVPGTRAMGSRRPSDRGFLFVSTSGQKLGGLGMSFSEGEHAAEPSQMLCWLHLGQYRGVLVGRNGDGQTATQEPDSRRPASPDLVPLSRPRSRGFLVDCDDRPRSR